MNSGRKSSAPDWSAIFAVRPDLEPPGYTEAALLASENAKDADRERFAEKMRLIHKQKIATKNKNRGKRK